MTKRRLAGKVRLDRTLVRLNGHLAIRPATRSVTRPLTRPVTRAVSASLLAGVAAIALALAQNPGYQPDPGWTPPARAAARRNPLAQKTDAAAGGRKLFQRNCAECHGADGSGIKNAADLRLPVVQEQTDGALFWKITSGNPARGMPVWSRLPEAQRWQLVMFLRTLKQQSEPRM